MKIPGFSLLSKRSTEESRKAGSTDSAGLSPRHSVSQPHEPHALPALPTEAATTAAPASHTGSEAGVANSARLSGTAGSVRSSFADDAPRPIRTSSSNHEMALMLGSGGELGSPSISMRRNGSSPSMSHTPAAAPPAPAEPAAVSAKSASVLSSIPKQLLPMYQRLGVVPPEMPVPLSMLRNLWQLPSTADVHRHVVELRDLGVVRVAVLDDGSTWSLVAAEHLAAIAEAYGDMLEYFHRCLLDAYSNNGMVPLKRVVDDGYIMQNMAHHLLGAARWMDLRELLTEPTWIEKKLHAYGVAAIVQDFRKYLATHADSDVKLLLQAFQLSLGCCMEHPTAHMLREQMLARLMAVAGDGAPPGVLSEWYQQQSGRVAADKVMAAGVEVVHLMPRTATLQQAGGLHRMTLRGHNGPVRKVVISPTGQDIITVSDDGTAQVWDMNIGDCVMQLARDRPLTDVAVAPDGQLCVVASEDGHCCIWDLASGKVKHVLKGHTDKVNAVAMDRQGIRCVTASNDRTVRVWSIYDGRCEQILQGHGSDAGTFGLVFDVAVSADGTLAATVSDDFTCRLWDLDEEECLHVLEGHSGWVVSVEFIGTTLDLVTASHDSTARVWDGWKGRCRFTLEGHTGRLNKVSVDPGGTYAVTCSDDNTARMWNLDTGACLCTFEGHNAWINDAAISRDGTHVITVSGDGMAIMWDSATGKMTTTMEGHSDNVRSVVLTFGGRFAVTASDDHTARVWDIQAPDLQRQDKHAGKVKQLLSLPGSNLVVSSGEDGRALVWQAGGGCMLHQAAGHSGAILNLAVSTSGQSFITASSDRKVCSWDAGSGALAHVLPPQQGSRVKCTAFDAVGQLVAVLLYDSTVSIWDLHSGQCVSQLVKRGDREVHRGGINAVYLDRSGSRAVTVSKDSTARVWDVASGGVLAVVQGHTDAVVMAALSPDETLLATGSYDNTTRVSRMIDGSPVAALALPSSPTTLVWAPQRAALLAVVMSSGDVVVWDVASTMPRQLVLSGHKDEVNGVAFTPDASLLATWGQDCTVRVWSTYTSKQIAFFMADAAVTACCFAGGSPVADLLVVGDAGGATHFLDFPEELQASALEAQ